MKKFIPLLVGAAALVGAVSAAQAHVAIGVGIGIPGPVYAAPVYAPPPVVYAPPPPVVYAPPPPVVYSPVVGGYYQPYGYGYGYGHRYWRHGHYRHW